MVIKGTLENGRLTGKPYSLDVGLDVVYVQVLPVEAAYSDYRTLPDTEKYKDRYVIIDFDKGGRVVGFTVEGLIEDFRNKSLATRVIVDLGLFGVKLLSERMVGDIQAYLRDHLPSLDEKGRLAPAYA